VCAVELIMASSATPNSSRAIPSTTTRLARLILSPHLSRMSAGTSAQPLNEHFVRIKRASWGSGESRGVHARSDASKNYFDAGLRCVELILF